MAHRSRRGGSRACETAGVVYLLGAGEVAWPKDPRERARAVVAWAE